MGLRLQDAPEGLAVPLRGQAEPITEVAQRHPHRMDEDLVRDTLHRWPS